MFSSVLLTLPFLVSALAQPHSLAQRHHPHLAGPPTARELKVLGELKERSYPKAHLGFPPASPPALNHVAGSKRDTQKMIRHRKKRSSCAAQAVAKNGTSSAVSGDVSAQPTSASVFSTQSKATSSAYVAVSSVFSAAESSITLASAVSSASYDTPYSSAVASSAAAASSGAAASSNATGSSGGLMDYIFPQGSGTADWTTVVDSSGALSFDAALKPLTAGKLPNSATAPDGSNALIANYPAGTYKYSSSTGHGYSFYTEGEHNSVEVTGAKEVLFSYSVYFPSGFQFVKGGKLPGLYGGTSLDTAKSCSGGRQDGRDTCFSARLMWRTNGMGEVYNYYPSAVYNNPSYCSTGPQSICNDNSYGDSIGRGAYSFATGEWTTVAIRLKLNDVGSSNGEQELFVNGESVISLTDLEISVNSDTKIYGIMAQTFFGGSDSSWASPVDQSAYFKDWSLAVLA